MSAPILTVIVPTKDRPDLLRRALESIAAQDAAGIETILQNVVDLLQGNIFRLFATIAVILIALAWMFGYMDLRRAGYWIVGIGVIAGSSELVSTIVGS